MQKTNLVPIVEKHFLVPGPSNYPDRSVRYLAISNDSTVIDCITLMTPMGKEDKKEHIQLAKFRCMIFDIAHVFRIFPNDALKCVPRSRHNVRNA